MSDALCWQFIPALPYEPFSRGLRRMASARPELDHCMTKSRLTALSVAGWGLITESSVPSFLIVLILVDQSCQVADS